MSKARQNLERRYWAAPNMGEAHGLWLRMSPEVRKRVGPANFTSGRQTGMSTGSAHDSGKAEVPNE